MRFVYTLGALALSVPLFAACEQRRTTDEVEGVDSPVTEPAAPSPTGVPPPERGMGEGLNQPMQPSAGDTLGGDRSQVIHQLTQRRDRIEAQLDQLGDDLEQSMAARREALKRDLQQVEQRINALEGAAENQWMQLRQEVDQSLRGLE